MATRQQRKQKQDREKKRKALKKQRKEGRRSKPKKTSVKQSKTKPAAKKQVREPDGVTFLYGPLDVQSSWVAKIGYIHLRPRVAGLAVMFLNGFSCIYIGTTPDMYQSMRKSRSKGRFVHRYLYHLEYEALS